MNNLVSAKLSDSDKEQVKVKLQEIQQLLPFLIALPAGQKRGGASMGQKSVEFVNLALRGATHFPQYLLQSFNKEEFANDVKLIDQLWDIRILVASLLENIDDTIHAASIDAMHTGNEVYGYLKVAAKKDASVKNLVDEMAKRYEKKKTKIPPSTT
ncbi:hypothetical protein ACI76W_07115 [Capnocytophaga canimorsus]|uniref:hypothetical protein n=1 Tax=Capnocytophaga canimorsus TaxID=28188 RepID=UPI00385F2FC2